MVCGEHASSLNRSDSCLAPLGGFLQPFPCLPCPQAGIWGRSPYAGCRLLSSSLTVRLPSKMGSLGPLLSKGSWFNSLAICFCLSRRNCRVLQLRLLPSPLRFSREGAGRLRIQVLSDSCLLLPFAFRFHAGFGRTLLRSLALEQLLKCNM